MDGLEFRGALISDAPRIHELVNGYADRSLMLPRPLMEIYESIRDFHVCTENGRVVACVAIHVSWQGLGEIRSLAVEEGYRRRGVATRLVQQCHRDAEMIGLKRVFVLTNTPALFTALGYVPIDKEKLPHKIWADCARCPKFPSHCDEVALIMEVALATVE